MRLDALTKPLLELDEVGCRFAVRRGLFGKRRVLSAVDGVSFCLRKGESLGLVGESGCGKTTLGKIVCGLQRPTTGRVLLEGGELPAAGAGSWAAGRIQMIFQDPFSSLNPRLTVGDSVREPLGALPRGERTKRAEQMLAAVGLGGVDKRYPHEFSGGQRQRIAVARALITYPDIVVCDEPVSALDASVQAQTLNLLRDVQERFGPAYLFISHDMAAVGFVCERILVMYLGQIVEEAPCEQFFSGAAHPYARALLASVPPGVVDNAWRQALPPFLEGEPPSPLAPPTGCRFHPRCPEILEICRTEAPALKGIAPNRRVRCHRWQSKGFPT
ncbi:MAG: oligopeptide/dipeptide ABC transporter ATP-binding protein [Candidatus Desulfovibrio kirbyi]|uniref:Oligopeptide/dipeptide ABC transporter ATP-binding protein n=1 Tax=Candidatus Desulfovibrio kirbyi TaxID=2696086 RepID=A0A6L2R5D5_9BACT|nr:MAG: oligopeptide/dipeptide ABC transporter ATP-binding protein [Candidatus Desulfovibrio kirbyi]